MEGVALFRKDKIEEAHQKLSEALLNSSQDPRRTAEINNDLGVVYQKLEDYPAAHQALDEAEALFLELDDRKGQAQTLAIATYKESAGMLEEIGESEMSMYVWQAVSRLRTKQGQYIAAIGAYEEGVSNMPKSSFKRKILEQILKAPGALLGGSGGKESDQDD